MKHWAIVPLVALALTACRRGDIALPPQASDTARLYAQECAQGTAASCYALGLLYGIGEQSGHGIPLDRAQAEHWLHVACTGGHAVACEGMPPDATAEGSGAR